MHLNFHFAYLRQINILKVFRQLAVAQDDVVSEIILASNREPTVLHEAVDSNALMGDGDVSSKVVGAEEGLVTEVTHVIALAKMDFLKKKSEN